MPHALQGSRRGGQARRLAGRRLPRRDSGDGVVGALPEAHDDALSQSAGDGNRGAAPRAPGGRRGADGRLRQDDAGDDHGRDIDEPADDVPAVRADAAGPVPRRDGRLGQRHLEILGRVSRRQHHRGRDQRARAGHRALARPLHDDGHRVDDDERRRGAGLHAARRGVDSGARLATRGDGGARRRAHRRDGVGRFQAVGLPHQSLVRQRGDHGAGDRRLDQRRRSSDRDGAPRRHSARPRPVRRARPQNAAAREHPAIGKVPDGGFLLRRRIARSCSSASAICCIATR